jgi:hypothetical protein
MPEARRRDRAFSGPHEMIGSTLQTWNSSLWGLMAIRARHGSPSTRRSFAPYLTILSVSVASEVFLLSRATEASIGGFLTDVGRALGKPFGGFIESLVTPSLRSIDDTLVADVDRRLGERIDQANRTASGLLDKTDALISDGVGQVDLAVASRLSQVDGIMAARIAQIGVTGDRLIDNAIGKLDGTLDKNIRLAGKEARKTLTQLNELSAQRLAQVDGILESRLNQLRGAVQQSVADVDRALEQRLEQVDELSERRLGNLDVIGTRQLLNLEGSLTRLAGLVATLALVVLMLFSLGRELWQRWEKAPEAQSFLKRVWAMTDRGLLASLARVVVAHATILAILLGILLLFSRRPSADVSSRANALLALYQSGFSASEQSLDYRAALYNASQLAIIEPEQAQAYNLRVSKLKLIRDTLVRSAFFERPETVRSLARRIVTLNAQIEAQTQSADPDLLTLQCYIRWQLSADRPSEGSAAEDCRRALEISGDGRGPRFLLSKLAHHYVAIQALFPSWGGSSDAVGKGSSEPLPGLEHVYRYDALVAALDTASTGAYIALLDAQVEVERALDARPRKSAAARTPPSASGRPTEGVERKLAEAKKARLDAARAVLLAWQQFDANLQNDEWISGTNSELAVFTLNDAVLTRALYVVAAPEADELPSKIKDIPDPLLRMRVVPPRVEWMRRYLSWVGDSARRLATFEESERFSAFEDEVISFERAYVAFKVAGSGDPVLRVRAVRAAAVLALYATAGSRRLPLANALLGAEKVDPAEQAEIEALANTRRLRLL